MTYDDNSPPRQVPGERFTDVLQILKLHDRGESYPRIANELDISKFQAYRVVQRREWDYERTKAIDASPTD